MPSIFTFAFCVKFFLALSLFISSVSSLPSSSPPYRVAARAAPAELLGRSYHIQPRAVNDASLPDSHNLAQPRNSYAPEKREIFGAVPLRRAERFQAIQQKRDTRRRRRDDEMTNSAAKRLSHGGGSTAPVPPVDSNAVSDSHIPSSSSSVKPDTPDPAATHAKPKVAKGSRKTSKASKTKSKKGKKESKGSGDSEGDTEGV